MNRFFTKSIALIALVGAFSLSTATRSEAAFYALICNDPLCDGAGDVIVQDNGAGDALSGTAGAISIAGSVGGLSIVVNTSQSKPLLGSATSPQMDMTYTVTGIGTVWLYASDTDFTGSAVLNGNIDGNFTGTANTAAAMARAARWRPR